MADEDTDDHLAIFEARKRLKTRQESRARLLDSNNIATNDLPPAIEPDDDIFAAINNAINSAQSAGLVDPNLASSFELGRDLSKDDVLGPVATTESAAVDEVDSKYLLARSAASLLTRPEHGTSLGELMDQFVQCNEHGEESVLWCAACFELPDDPILTSCLHLYCLECFSEMLVEAKEEVGRPVGRAPCEAYGCEGFPTAEKYQQLSPIQFQMLASSVGITVHDPGNNVSETSFPSMPSLDAFSGPWNDISNQDDVAALWQTINSDPAVPLVQNTQFVSSSLPLFPDLVDAAKRTHEEELLDGLHDSDDDWYLQDAILRYQVGSPKARSEGYATSDDDNSNNDAPDHPFIHDGPIPKPAKYILDTESAKSTESNSDDYEYGSDESDISATEVRLLKREWPDEWRLTNNPGQHTSVSTGGPNYNGWFCARIS